MKHDFAFVAERTLARHSAVLLRPGPADADLLHALNQIGQRLARSLRGALARLCGGRPPTVEIDAPVEVSVADFARPGLCAYSLYEATPPGVPLFGAIDAEALLRLVDRAFGGPGEAPQPLPRELPLSADLMLQRLEAIIATQFALALPGAEGARAALHPLRRSTDWSELPAGAAATRLARLDIAVSEGLGAAWHIRLALPLVALPALTGLAPGAPAAPRSHAPANPGDEPFAALPLTLTARLIDTRLPLRTISQLEPGQVLNLPIARQVPLLAGQHAIGQGTIGAVDGSVAIQLSRLT